MPEQGPQPERKFVTTDPELVKQLEKARIQADERVIQPDPKLAQDIAVANERSAGRPETGARTAYKSPELDLEAIAKIREQSQRPAEAAPTEALPQIGQPEQPESAEADKSQAA